MTLNKPTLNCYLLLSCHLLISTFKKKLIGIPSECQTDWIQILPYVPLGIIWVQSVAKVYQQTTLEYKANFKFLPAAFLLSEFFLNQFLAHLSRRQMGELIVYQSLQGLSVHQSSVVCPSTFSNIFCSETTGPIKLKFHMEAP